MLERQLILHNEATSSIPAPRSYSPNHLQEPLLEDKKKKEAIQKLVRYWMRNRGTHFRYTLRFLLCELLSLVIVVLQVWLTFGVL